MEKLKLKFYILLCKQYLWLVKKVEDQYKKDPRIIIDFRLMCNKAQYQTYLEIFQEELRNLEEAEK